MGLTHSICTFEGIDAHCHWGREKKKTTSDKMNAVTLLSVNTEVQQTDQTHAFSHTHTHTLLVFISTPVEVLSQGRAVTKAE